MNNKNKLIYTVYTEREKILLAELVKEHGKIIENKRTDGATVGDKNKAWELLARIYNSQPEVNVLRTAYQLKKLWANLKLKKRKQSTELRYSMLATGGGPPKKPAFDPVLQVVEEAAPNLDIVASCPFDSTAVFEREQRRCTTTQHDSFLDSSVDESLESEVLDGSLPPSSITEAAIPSISVSTPTADRLPYSNTKSTESVLIEKLWSQKLTQSIRQEKELFLLKKRVAEEELGKISEERELAKIKMELEIKKAKHEEQLAAFKLQTYKRMMH